MIEIYVNNDKLDLTTDVSVPMNYELEKLQNPTIIKNNFSKTITLEATPQNNKIFGYYYKLDKITSGSGFSAIERVPFTLYRDSDLIESGYLQLNSIKYTNNRYQYEITLYGGLGDFFYNLSYDEEGNDKSLADLDYGFGENDEGFEFKINADNVVNAWHLTGVGNGQFVGDTLTFIPSYNGIYEDFDNNKVLINTNGTTIFPSEITGDTTYTTIGGYGMAELNNEMTEWQIRDLRCYKQRPAISLRSFINAICKPENNGGYEVELDGANFFNRENPYYRYTYIALPMLNPDSEEFPTTEVDVDTTIDSSFAIDVEGNYINQSNITYENNLAEEFGGNSTINVSVDFSLMTQATAGYGNLILSGVETIDRKQKPLWGGIGIWLEAVIGGETIAMSDCYVFTKGLYNGDNGYVVPKVGDFSANWFGEPRTNYVYVDGSFLETSTNSGEYIFTSESLNTFQLKIKNVPNYENVKIKICSKRWYKSSQKAAYPECFWTSSFELVPITSLNAVELLADTIVKQNVNKKTLQDVTITKKQLLKNKITPASLLTSFTKLFGLYFVKAATQKKITICTRNKFFENAEVVDLTDRIDYSKELKIEPLMFNKKWYKLSCPALETTQMKTYKADYYEAEYGQKRINTNYNFNTETEDIYKDNQYQNIITMLDSSKYYKNFVKAGENAPTFGLDGCKYRLWLNADVDDSTEIEYVKKDLMDSDSVQFGTLVSADAMPKLCCFDDKDNKQSLNDLNVSLVFYNGLQYLEDIEGNPIYYTISNDIPLMSTVNDGTPMYLWTNSTKDVDGNTICQRGYALPQFTRYDIQFGNVINSMDFGLPLETYINTNYGEESTLYNQFWQKFYQDQFNQDTRKLTAYVRFADYMLGNHSLSNFYYFENCYWLLNKIIDYDIANPNRLVKCEFIKINDIANYTNGQKTFIAFFDVDVEVDNCSLTNISPQPLWGDDWSATVESEYGFVASVSDGTGDITNTDRVVIDDNTITVKNITSDVYVYVKGKESVTMSVVYYFADGVTPTDEHIDKTLEMAFDSTDNVVWSNNVTESDGMDITEIEPSTIYFRVTNNTYESDNRLALGWWTIITYTDGTTQQITISTSIDNWNAWSSIDQTKTIRQIEIKVYNFSTI